MTFKNAVLRACPKQYDEFIGENCTAVFDGVLIMEFISEGIKTSPIVEHSEKGRIHTFKTRSGSVYKIEIF